MKNLFIIFFLFIVQVGQTSPLKNQVAINDKDNQFITTGLNCQPVILKENLLVDDFITTDFELAGYQNTILFYFRKNTYKNFENKEIILSNLIPLFYDLPPPTPTT